MKTREQRDAVYGSPRFQCLEARAASAMRELEAALRALNAEFPVSECMGVAGGFWQIGKDGRVTFDVGADDVQTNGEDKDDASAVS